MPYVTDRTVLDADAHIMEGPGWLASYVAPGVREHIPPMDGWDADFAALLAEGEHRLAARRSDPDEHAAARRDLMSMPRKGWLSLGGADPAERSIALDELGFAAQVVYPTGSFPQVAATPAHAAAEAARGMNRGLAEFCAGDPRLLATAYLPLHLGIDVALDLLHDAVARGAAAVMVDMIPAPGAKAAGHPDHDRLWAAIVDADVLLTVHVGLDSGWRPVRPELFDNGRTLEHFRSDAPGDALTYLAIGYPAELFLGSIVLDGVLERFPTLRISVTELGAVWVPGFLRHLDVAARAFRRLQDLSHLTMAPSEYIRRQVRFTPFPGEPVGWLIEQAGPELLLFSSDYPHHEGSDDPIRRFEDTMHGVSEEDRRRFYETNLADILGSHALQAAS